MNSTITRRLGAVVLGEALGEQVAARTARETAMRAAPGAAATFERSGLRGAAPGAAAPGASPLAITNPASAIAYRTPAPAAMSAEHRAANEARDAIQARLAGLARNAPERPRVAAELDTANRQLAVHETRAAVDHMTHVIRHTPANQPEGVVRSLYRNLADGQARHADALAAAGAPQAEVIAAHNAAGHSFARAARTDLSSTGRAWVDDMGSALRHFARAGDHRSISEMFRRADAGQTEAALGLLRQSEGVAFGSWERNNMEQAARGMLDDMFRQPYSVPGAVGADGTRGAPRLLPARAGLTETEFADVARRARGSGLASDAATWVQQTLRLAQPR